MLVECVPLCVEVLRALKVQLHTVTLRESREGAPLEVYQSLSKGAYKKTFVARSPTKFKTTRRREQTIR